MSASIRNLPPNNLFPLKASICNFFLARFAERSRKEVDSWNDKVRVGQTIQFKKNRLAAPMLKTTVNQAELLSDDTPVVWLKGVGCVHLSACIPVDQQKIVGTV